MLERKILVEKSNGFIKVAIMENDKLVEFNIYDTQKEPILQNIYIGKVKAILPGMQSAFIDIGMQKNAYMYLNKNIHKDIKNGDEILVQVMKEPISTKGAVVTTDIALPGKYLVMTPLNNQVTASRKITNDSKKQQLIDFVKNSKNQSGGFIIRTDAQNKPKELLLKEIKILEEQWTNIEEFSKYKTCYSLIYNDSPLIRVIRDVFNDTVSQFIINDEEEYKNIKSYVELHYPGLQKKLELYEDADWPLFELYKVNSSISKALKPKIWLKNGASIIIEQTEALVSIDVNSSKYTGKRNFEETIFKVNKEAASEIARQLRLRNLSGIIIVDFIDMKTEEFNDKLVEIFKRELSKDRIKTTVLGMTNLGLVEMTRKKTHKSILHQLTRRCDKCNGTGVIDII